MKCTCIVLLLFLMFQIRIAEKFVAILFNHNTNVDYKLDQTKENVRNNLNNILRATKCKKKGTKCKGFKSKIVGGFVVQNISKYPYHARYGLTCGAVIIGIKWAITAAHCGRSPIISVGSKYSDKGERYRIKKFHVHPNWESKHKTHFFDYDYQILELDKNLVLSDKVKPIKIGWQHDLRVGSIVTVTGWGRIYNNGPSTRILNAVEVPIVSFSDCQKVKFPMFQNRLTPRMFCAGYFRGGKDACQGDSGGGAVANGHLLGLVSFGYGCATPGSYGVYADVVYVKSWINSTIS